MKWVALPALVAAYLVSVVLDLDAAQTRTVVVWVLPPALLFYGGVYPRLSLWLVARHAMAAHVEDAPGQRLCRLLSLPWRAAVATIAGAWTLGGVNFTFAVAWLYGKGAFEVALGTVICSCFGVLIALPFALSLERLLLPLVLREQRRHEAVAPQGRGFFWPRLSWLLPFTFVTMLSVTLLLSGGVIAAKVRVARRLLEQHLRTAGPQEALSQLDLVGGALLSEAIGVLGWVFVLMFILPALTAWLLARRQARGAEAVRAAIESLSAGRPTAPEWASTDEVGDLAAGMNAVLARLRELPLSLQSAARQLSQAAEQLQESNQSQHESVTRQAAALHQTHVTSEEIKQTSQVAADRAQEVLGVARRAEELGLRGETAVAESLSELTAIQEAVEGIQARLRALAASTSQVGDITQTVKDLADQSNILAINAAIEAMRVGETGRSFSVVARQMRSLADQSVQATKRIRTVLDDIRRGVHEAAQMGEQSVKQIASGLQEMRTSGDSLRQLSGISRESSAAAMQIAAAVTQQHVGINQVFSAIGDLSSLMDATLQRLERTREATEALPRVSQDVVHVARQYGVT